jgi:glucose-6-phosphate isomerase
MTLRFNPTNAALGYDPSACFIPETGIDKADLAALAPKLEAARAETLADVDLWKSNGPVPAEKQPLDAGFIDLPERLLAEYKANRSGSELGRILATASRLRDTIDKIVVLGIGGSYMGARALFEACCHPYHNELPRGARGGKPRIYFEGNNVDNDAVQGLLDLLGCNTPGARMGSKPEDRWGIAVISKSGGTLETAAAFRLFWTKMLEAVGGDKQLLSQLIVPVTGKSGRLFELSKALGCPDLFDIPDGVGGRFSILTAVGLLPAAVIGIDIVRLLEGAAAMNTRFRSEGAFSNRTALGSNPVLDYVGVCHLLEAQRGANIRLLSTWGKGLEAAGFWYDQLLSESLGKHEQGATPLTVVNTRDLHSRGQQHQEGRRDKLVTNVIVHSQRRDRLSIEKSDLDQDKLNDFAGKSYPEILTAAIAGTNQAYAEDRRPTADLHLPGLDEYSMGQLFQMLMLTTVVEGRLIGINPYGQPGVEAYKKHMQAFLRK